jgi:hypothetical protein
MQVTIVSAKKLYFTVAKNLRRQAPYVRRTGASLPNHHQFVSRTCPQKTDHLTPIQAFDRRKTHV